jgi:hypothetical protein
MKRSETKTINMRGLKHGETPEDVLLQDGDRIEVPRMNVF